LNREKKGLIWRVLGGLGERGKERERKGLREGIKKPGENENENHCASGR